MRVLLGVTGCIGAYKAPDLVRELRRAGAVVTVMLTRGAGWFVAEGALQTVSGRPVYTDQFRPQSTDGIEHINLARQADLLLVAPATANILGKFASGIADDFLTTTYLAFRGPVLMAPAMNTAMYTHAAVQANIKTLTDRGVELLGPASGELACGEVGEGRLLEPAEITRAVLQCLGDSGVEGSLSGRTVLVSSGPTREPIDAVRFVSNGSSGRMGHALARAARRRGARVILVSGPTALADPEGVEVIRVTTVREMREAVLAGSENIDLVLMAAAVGDHEVVRPASSKIKKSSGPLSLELALAPDILAELGRRRGDEPRPVLVGFAAETEALLEGAAEKLRAKNLDYIVANRIGDEDAGFGARTNRVSVLRRDGESSTWPLLAKDEVAERLLEQLVAECFAQPGSRALHSSPVSGD